MPRLVLILWIAREMTKVTYPLNILHTLFVESSCRSL